MKMFSKFPKKAHNFLVRLAAGNPEIDGFVGDFPCFCRGMHLKIYTNIFGLLAD